MAVIFQVQTQTAVSSIEQFNAAIRASGKVVGEFTTQTVKLNEQGNITSGVINQMSASGQKLSATFAVVGNAAQVMGAQARVAGEEGAKGGQQFGVSWQGLVRIMEVQLFRRGVTAVVNSIRDGIQSAIQYQIQLQQVANITNQSGERLGAFAARVRSLSEAHGINMFAGLGAAQIALTGQLGNATAGFEVLNQAMRLSTATGVDVADATRLITTALEAFHLEASQSSQVANTFFLTAQRSRIPLGDTQAAIGRVSQTAQALGITFEQMNALFLTVAQQGGRPTEAFSLLNQVMGRLIQPTEKLQEFLNSLGTPTAALAVQTFGLTGFLQKLNETASQSPERLGDLAGSVRTLRGLLALSGDSTIRFQENLQALGEGANQLSEAVKRVELTPAQQLRVEFEKMKNVFAQDIGQQFIETVVGISRALGGADVTIQAFIGAVKTLGLAFIALRLGNMALGFAAMTVQIQATGSAAAITANQVGMIGTAALGAFAAGFALGELFKTIAASLEAARVSAVLRVITEELKKIEEANERTRAATNRQVQESNQFISDAYSRRIDLAARAVATANRNREIEINNQRAIQDAIRITGQTFLDGLRQKVSALRESVNQAENSIRGSIRSAAEFGRQVESGGFQRRLGAEQDPEAAIRMLQQRVESQQAQARAIFTSPRASQEEIARARSMFTEINRMQGEIGDREREITRARDEQTGQWREQVINGRLVRVFHSDFTRDLQRENALIETRNQLEQTYRDNLEKQRLADEKRLATAQLRVRVFDALLRQAQEFRVITATGEFTPEIQREEERRPGGGAAAARRQLTELQAAIRKAVAEHGGDLTTLQPLFDQQVESLERQLRAQENVNASTQRLNTISDQARTDAQARAGAIRQQAAILEDLGRQAAGVGTRLTAIATTLQGFRPRFTDEEQIRLATRWGEEVAQGARDYNTFLDAVNAAREAQARFSAQGGQTEANARAFAAAVQRVGEALGPIRNLQQQGALNLSRLGLENVFQRGFFDLVTRLEGAREGIPLIQRGAQDILSTFTEGTQLRTLQTLIDAIEGRAAAQPGAPAAPGAGARENFRAIPAEATAAGRAMILALEGAQLPAAQLNTQVREILAGLREIGQLQVAPGQAAGGVAGRRSMGGLAGWLAGGGIAGLHPGAPKGTDILPYWLTPGEFIMPAEQTRQFYTQLLAMRSGQQPKYAAGGGVVTTVGDIHLHLDGSGPTEKTIRDIGRGLDREIRRGTIRLGRPS